MCCGTVRLHASITLDSSSGVIKLKVCAYIPSLFGEGEIMTGDGRGRLAHANMW